MQARAEAQKKAVKVLTSIVEKGPPIIRLLTNQNVTQTQTQKQGQPRGQPKNRSTHSVNPKNGQPKGQPRGQPDVTKFFI